MKKFDLDKYFDIESPFAPPIQSDVKEAIKTKTKTSEDPIQFILCKELFYVIRGQMIYLSSNKETLEPKYDIKNFFTEIWLFGDSYVRPLMLIQSTSHFVAYGLKSLLHFLESSSENEANEFSAWYKKNSKWDILLNVLQCRRLLKRDPTCDAIFSFISRKRKFSSLFSQIGIESARRNFAECYNEFMK